MNSDPDFKNMWRGQSSVPPDTELLFAKAKQVKRSQMRRIFFTNLLLGLTSIFIVFVWVKFNPEMITTKIGIILMVFAMGMFGVLYGRLRPVLEKINDAKSSRDFLDSLLELKRKQQFLHTVVMNFYFILLSAGIGLYMIEFAMKMSVGGAIAAYAITATWILFNWFYLRPRTIRKQRMKVDELIEKFGSIKEQLND